MRSLALVVPLLLVGGSLFAQDVKGLSKRLGAPEPEAREEAAKALGKLGKEAIPAIPALLQASRDKNFKVRLAVATTLGGLGAPPEPEVQKRLVELLSDKGGAVQAAAAESLVRVRACASAVGPLAKLLSNRQWKVRVSGLRALGTAGVAGESALARIEGLGKNDPSASVRAQASASAKQIRAAIEGKAKAAIEGKAKAEGAAKAKAEAAAKAKAEGAAKAKAEAAAKVKAGAAAKAKAEAAAKVKAGAAAKVKAEAAAKAGASPASGGKRFLGATFREGLRGLVVASVTPGCAALGLDLAVGSPLVSIDDQPVRTLEDLERVLKGYAVGERINLDRFSMRSGDERQHTLSAADWVGLKAKPQTSKPKEDTGPGWARFVASSRREADWAAGIVALRPRIAEALPALIENSFNSASNLYPFARVVFPGLGEAAVPGLLANLDSKDSRIRQYSVQLLGLVGPPASRAVEKLQALAADPDDDHALLALCQIAGDTPEVRKLLEVWVKVSGGPRHRQYDLRRAAEILGRRGDHALLAKLLTDPNPEVRENVVEGIRRAGPKAAAVTPAILAQINVETSSSAYLDLHAALGVAAGSEHVAAVLPVLLRALPDERSHGAYGKAAMWALTEFGEPAIAPLAKVITTNTSWRARDKAAIALSILAEQHASTVAPLRKLLTEDDSDLLSCAGRGLGRSKTAEGKAALEELFTQGKSAAVKSALETLAKNSTLGPGFAAAIVKATESKDRSVRKAAVSACGALGLKGARPALRAQFDAVGRKESDPAVTCLRALIAIGPSEADLPRYTLALGWGRKARSLALRGFYGLGPGALKAVAAIAPSLASYTEEEAEDAERILLRLGTAAIAPLEAAKAGQNASASRAIDRVVTKLKKTK
ncbi:MAG: HEAT repeat domain-containing protein [Planctomycetes bacterium]|nr:HEAT repeat domain-containing protein [Planctomycetota bacterium]